MKKKPKSQHGGPRPGSGRPVTTGRINVRLMVSLPPEMAAWLRERGPSQTVQDLIAKSPDFQGEK